MPSEKQIRCTRCNCLKYVPLFWQFSTCKDCLKKKREYREQYKTKIKAREKLKPIKAKFMSFEDYKRYFPQASRESYERERKKFEQQTRLNGETDSLMEKFPCKSQDCWEFREQLFGYKPKQKLFFALHHNNCRPCARFWAIFRDYWRETWQGCDIWHPENEEEN